MSEAMVLPETEKLEIINRQKPTVPPEKYFPYDSAFGDVPPMASYFEGYRFHVTGLNHDKSGFPTTNPTICHNEEVRMLRKIEANLKGIEKYEEINTGDAKILLVSFGNSARSAKVAMLEARNQGLKVGLFRPITVWPFPYDRLRALSKKLKAVIVPEMNLGQMRGEVEKALGPEIPVYGVNKVGGVPIEPEEIMQKILEVK
jgi:2-oxoglutarate ferredoxin oxidoreductase subunit alpha